MWQWFLLDNARDTGSSFFDLAIRGRMDTEVKSVNRFDDDARRYAAYLETPEGRLRSDLTFLNLRDFLPTPSEIETLRALDLGSGTGALAVSLARLGVHVTLLDSSPAMMAQAERLVAEASANDRVTMAHGDAARSAELFQSKSFDVILCHNLLEYVDDPVTVLRGAVRLLRDSSAILSVLVRNQAGEVLKAALRAGDLDLAENNLTAEWARESLYGGKVRLFTPESLEAVLKGASLTIRARRGVRVIADYLPGKISRPEEYQRIFSLERRLASRPEFFGVARYLHCFGVSANHGLVECV